MLSSMKHAVCEGSDHCRILKKTANANCVFFCNIATFISSMYHQKSILITIVSINFIFRSESDVYNETKRKGILIILLTKKCRFLQEQLFSNYINSNNYFYYVFK